MVSAGRGRTKKKQSAAFADPYVAGGQQLYVRHPNVYANDLLPKKKSHVFGTRLYCLFMFIVWLAKHTPT